MHQSWLKPPRRLLVLYDRHTANKHKQGGSHQLSNTRLKYPLEFVWRSGCRLLSLWRHEWCPNITHLHLLVCHGSSVRSELCKLQRWHWALCPEACIQICLCLIITRTLVCKDSVWQSCSTNLSWTHWPFFSRMQDSSFVTWTLSWQSARNGKCVICLLTGWWAVPVECLKISQFCQWLLLNDQHVFWSSNVRGQKAGPGSVSGKALGGTYQPLTCPLSFGL